MICGRLLLTLTSRSTYSYTIECDYKTYVDIEIGDYIELISNDYVIWEGKIYRDYNEYNLFVDYIPMYLGISLFDACKSNMNARLYKSSYRGNI